VAPGKISGRLPGGFRESPGTLPAGFWEAQSLAAVLAQDSDSSVSCSLVPKMRKTKAAPKPEAGPKKTPFQRAKRAPVSAALPTEVCSRTPAA
jgi:hypothetical protein